MKKKESTQIRIMRYAEEHPAFIDREMFIALNLTNDEKEFFAREVEVGGGVYFCRINPARAGAEHRYMLSLEGQSRLGEHDELIFARQASQEAKRLAWIAIAISLIVGGVQIFWTQDVRVVGNNQDGVSMETYD
jgi:hypothetical protein